MAIRIKDTTREYLCSVPLPVHADSYTVISHESVMDYAVQELTKAGFVVQDESYRCTADGSIAQGIYYLNHQGDDELGMMFAWANSYNKQMRFKCAIGGYVYTSLSSMFASDMSVWGRKHTGTADSETIQTIADQISNAKFYYDRLLADKAIMKQIKIDYRRQAELLGVLFAEYEILTTEQASFVKSQMDKPLYHYNATGTLWEFYNHMILALKKSHPREWMEDQRKLHWFLAMEYDFASFYNLTVAEAEDAIEDPLASNYGQPENQTNLLTQIAELEAAHFPIPSEESHKPIEIHIESDQEYLERVADIEGEPEDIIEEKDDMDKWLETVEELELEDIEPFVEPESVLQYTDPAGNSFEAPVVTQLEPTPEEVVEFEASTESIPDEVYTPEVVKPDFDFDLSLDDDEEDAPVGEFFL